MLPPLPRLGNRAYLGTPFRPACPLECAAATSSTTTSSSGVLLDATSAHTPTRVAPSASLCVLFQIACPISKKNRWHQDARVLAPLCRLQFAAARARCTKRQRAVAGGARVSARTAYLGYPAAPKIQALYTLVVVRHYTTCNGRSNFRQQDLAATLPQKPCPSQRRFLWDVLELDCFHDGFRGSANALVSVATRQFRQWGGARRRDTAPIRACAALRCTSASLVRTLGALPKRRDSLPGTMLVVSRHL